MKQELKQIVVDGNDGTGKSTLVKSLIELGYNAVDRGIPTKMTDDETLNAEPDNNATLYLILEGTVEESRKRLAASGKDLNEKYHTVEDLTHYHQKYREVWRRMCETVGGSVSLIWTTGKTQEEVVKLAVQQINLMLRWMKFVNKYED